MSTPADATAGTGTTVAAMLERTVRRVPEREALVFLPLSGAPASRLSYAELWDEATRAAGFLAERAPTGARVAVWARNCPEWIVAQLASYLAGLVVVPINPSYGQAEAGYALRTTRAAVLFHDREPDAVADLTEQCGVELALPLATARRQWSTAAPTVRPVQAGDVAQVQFTSGTTGRPKGAQLTNAGLTTTPVIASRCLGLSEGARWLNVTPMFHIGGCVLPVMGCLALGATHVLGERYRTEQVLAAFGSEQISFFGGVPTMWWDLLDRYDPAVHRAGSLEVVMTGGAPVPEALVRRIEDVFGARLVVAYGQTEAHGHITQTHIAGAPDPGNTGPTAIGRPLPHTRIRIVRPDGSEAAPDEAGELVASSPTLMVGYLDRPEDTARALDAAGDLHTGDVCSIDAQGVVSFVGRLSELVVRGGEKVAPAEVEAALLEHPAVARVAVAGVPDRRLGERVAAFVVTAQGSAPDSAQLIEFLAPRLARFKIPEVWQFVADLPLAPTGKIAKAELVRRWVAGETVPSA